MEQHAVRVGADVASPRPLVGGLHVRWGWGVARAEQGVRCSLIALGGLPVWCRAKHNIWAERRRCCV